MFKKLKLYIFYSNIVIIAIECLLRNKGLPSSVRERVPSLETPAGPSLLANYLSSHCTGAKILKSFFIFGFLRSLVSLLFIFSMLLYQVNIQFKLPK